MRFNDNGTLLVPHGYVGALACDPIEKKPFFHVLPGSDALTFGMLGCDFHCGYCFTPDTTVYTNRGPISFQKLFESVARKLSTDDAQVALPQADGERLSTIAASGTMRRIEGVFKHPYSGPLCVIQPRYLPALKCTPEHGVYATDDPAQAPTKIEARCLMPRHYLAVPRRHAQGAHQTIDVSRELSQYEVVHKVRWKLPVECAS